MSFASAKLHFNHLEIWAVVIVHEISEVVEIGLYKWDRENITYDWFAVNAIYSKLYVAIV